LKLGCFHRARQWVVFEREGSSLENKSNKISVDFDEGLKIGSCIGMVSAASNLVAAYKIIQPSSEKRIIACLPSEASNIMPFVLTMDALIDTYPCKP